MINFAAKLSHTTDMNKLYLTILVIAVVMAYGAVAGLSRVTLVSPVAPLLASMVGAAALFPLFRRLWGRIAGRAAAWIGLVCHIVAVTGLLAATFYLLNYCLAPQESRHSEAAVVERRYTETHYRSKRVGRNRYVRGEPYDTYHIEVRLPSGWTRPLEVNLRSYRGYREGDTVQIPVARGMLGFPVIKGSPSPGR